MKPAPCEFGLQAIEFHMVSASTAFCTIRFPHVSLHNLRVALDEEMQRPQLLWPSMKNRSGYRWLHYSVSGELREILVTQIDGLWKEATANAVEFPYRTEWKITP